MKKVEAYIKKSRFNEVIEQLHMIEGLTGVSTHEIKGFGRMQNNGGLTRIVDNTVNWEPHIKIEIMCVENLVSKIVDTIEKAAHTGLRADGKIYISNIEEAIRIATSERGEKAI